MYTGGSVRVKETSSARCMIHAPQWFERKSEESPNSEKAKPFTYSVSKEYHPNEPAAISSSQQHSRFQCIHSKQLRNSSQGYVKRMEGEHRTGTPTLATLQPVIWSKSISSLITVSLIFGSMNLHKPINSDKLTCNEIHGQLRQALLGQGVSNLQPFQ